MRGEGTGLQSNGRQGDASYDEFRELGIWDWGLDYPNSKFLISNSMYRAKTFGKQVSQTYLCDPVSKRNKARSSKG
jgi:hypothetical protein